MKKRFFLVMLLPLILIPSISFSNCNISPAQKNKLLSMPYDAFDQQQYGWRQYAKLGCYHEAGVLIDKYVDEKKITLAEWQIIALTFHAGQVYAHNNEYKIAKIRFENSINPNEPKNTPLLWNDYVYATIAFLDNDLTKLKFYRNKIANGPTLNGKKTNLDVVDNLIRYFGQPYSVAYHANAQK